MYLESRWVAVGNKNVIWWDFIQVIDSEYFKDF